MSARKRSFTAVTSAGVASGHVAEQAREEAGREEGPTEVPEDADRGPEDGRAVRGDLGDLRGSGRDALEDVRDAGAEGRGQGVRRDVRRRDDLQARARGPREGSHAGRSRGVRAHEGPG